MPSTKKECAYVKCDAVFYGGKRAVYCCDRCGKYQRRLNQKALNNANNNNEPE